MQREKKITRWKNTGTFNQALRDLFKHFDEARSFTPIVSTLNSNQKFTEGRAYGLGIPEDSLPDEIRRMSRGKRVHRIIRERVGVNNNLNKALLSTFGSSNGSKYAISVTGQAFLDGITSPAVKDLLSRKNGDLEILIGLSDNLPPEIDERLRIDTARSRDLYLNRFVKNFPATRMRNAIVTSWIKEERDLAKTWNVFDSTMIEHANIHDAGTRQFFEDFIDQDVHSIVSKLETLPTLDHWNSRIVNKLVTFNKMGLPWAKKDLINFYDTKVTNDIVVSRTARVDQPGKISLNVTIEKRYANNVFDYLLNRYDDPDVVTEVMKNIFLDRQSNFHGNNRVMAGTRTDEGRLPYTLDEFKQYLFKKQEGENWNGDLHANILKQWYLDSKSMGIKFACDATRWLIDREHEKPKEERDLVFLRKAINNASRMKRNGECSP